MVLIDLGVIKVLLVFGGLLLMGVTATKTAARIGVPALVGFILVGMILGSDISGLIYFDDAWSAQLVGTMALVIILFEGGLQTKISQLKKVAVPALSLATLGVFITVVITGLLTYLVLDVSLPLALLVGAIVGSTDAAAVFAVIGNQNIPARLKSTLEAESGINDPMAVFLTILMMDWVQTGPPNVFGAVLFLVWQMGLGAAAGWIMGRATAWGLPKLRFESSGLYPILLFSIAMFTFALTSWLNGSGFVAVYVLAVYLGSQELPYKQSVLRFHEGMAWLSQMVMFILLGLLVFPAQMAPVALPSLFIAAGLILFARPVAVFLSTWRMGFNRNERMMLSWAGLRGAVPIILATFPLLAGVEGSDKIFNVVFFVVLTSAVIQGASISKVADKLGLVSGVVPTQPVTLELVAMEKLNVDLIEVVLPEGGIAVGRRLMDLNLPTEATVSAVLRDG